MLLYSFCLFGQGTYSGIGTANIASTDTFNIVSMKYDKTQNLYVLGSFKGTLTVGSQSITGAATTTGIGQNLFLAKYSSAGTLLWLKNADRANPQVMTIDNNGNLYIAGKFLINAVFGSVTLAGDNNTKFTEHVFVSKYDANGNVVYAKQFLMNGIDIGPTVYRNTTNCTETQQSTLFYNTIGVNDLVVNNDGALTLAGSFTGQFMSVKSGTTVTTTQYQTNMGSPCGIRTGTATTTNYNIRVGYKMAVSAAGESLGVTSDLTNVFLKLAITPSGAVYGVADKIDKGNSTGKYEFSGMNLNSNVPSTDYIKDIIALNDSVFYVAGNFRGQMNYWNSNNALVSFIAKVNTSNSSKFKLQVVNNEVNVTGTGASFLRICLNAAKDGVILLGSNKCELYLNDNSVNTKKSIYLAQYDTDLNYKWSKFSETSSELLLGNRSCALSVNANDEIFCAGEYLGSLKFGSTVLNAIKKEVFFSKYKYAPPAVVPITIASAEYFYDTDPGVGKGTVITNIAGNDSVVASKTIPTTGLTAGYHNLFVRFKYNNNQWSTYDPRIVYVIPAIIPEAFHQIVGAEYFFDTDPGKGNGVAMSGVVQADSITLSKAISANGINKGFHNLYVRTKNTVGLWSMPESRLVYVQSPKSVYLLSKVAKLEYFIDQLPSTSTGLSTIKVNLNDSVSVTANVATQSLAAGFHTLYVRAQDSLNVNGLYESRAFYIQPVVKQETLSPIVKTEYFFNTDPGFNKGTIFNSFTASDSVSLSMKALPAGLQNGANNLFIRVQNSAGIWSHTVSKTFTIDPKAGITDLNLLGLNCYPNPVQNNLYIQIPQYLLGNNYTLTDPIGKAMVIGAFSDINSQLNLQSLSPGVYFLRVNGIQGSVKIVKY